MERGQVKAKISHIRNHQNTDRILNICPGLELLIFTGFLSLKGWDFSFRSCLSTVTYLYYHLPRGLCQDSSHEVPAYTNCCHSLPDKGENSAWSLHRVTCFTWAPDITSTLGLYYSLNGVWCFHLDEFSFTFTQEQPYKALCPWERRYVAAMGRGDIRIKVFCFSGVHW